MARSGDFVTPVLWGERWFEKPPLLYWMIAAGWGAGLTEETAARVPLAALSVAFLVFFYIWTRREWGRSAAAYATAVLSTSAGWLAYSRVAVTDLPLSVMSGASLLLLLRWIRSGGRRGLVASGLLLGMAALAKGLVPLVLAAPVLWFGRRRSRDLLIFGAAAVAIAVPWYWLCYLRSGQLFLDVFFWQHHFGRFVKAELQHVQPWWFYLPVLIGLLFPWAPMLAAIRNVPLEDRRIQFLLAYSAWGLFFFSASTNKLPGYVLPLLPPLALLTGVGLSRATVRFAAAISATLLLLVPFAAAVVPGAVATGLRRAWSAEVDVTVLTLLAVVVLAIFWLDWRKTQHGFSAALVAAYGSYLWLLVTILPQLDRVASARPLWHQMQLEGKTGCADAQSRGIRYGLNYYAGRELPACSAERRRNHDNLDRE